MLIYRKAITKQERFTVITGKGYRPRQIALGKWKHPALGLIYAYLFLTVVLPFFVFAWTSLLPYPLIPGRYGVVLREVITLEHWKMVFTYSDIWTTIVNTLWMTFLSSTMVIVMAFMVSWIVIRTKFVFRYVLDQIAFIPHGIPGIIFSLAMIWVWLKLDFIIPIYGTVYIIALAFAIHFIPYGTRAINAGLLQIHKEIEEAAYISGATTNQTFRKIVFPLLMPVFVGVWIWVFLHAIRIVGVPIMLFSGTKNQVLAVLLWRLWDDGYLGAVSAIGLLLMTFLMVLTLVVRRLGFRRHHSEQ